jgi:hypothetical protein
MATKNYQIVDAVLTEIAQGFHVGESVYDRVLPVIQVNKTAGKAIRWDEKSFRLESSKRALGAGVKSFDHEFDTMAFALPDGYSRKVTCDWRADQQAQGISNLAILEQKMMIELRAMELEKELEVANLVTTVGNYAANHAAVSANWGTASTDIFGDIEARKHGVADLIGVFPNRLIVTRDVWKAMRSNTKLQSFFVNTTPGAANLQPKMLADLFEIEEIIIPNAIYMTSGGVRTNIWGTAKAILLYSAPKAGPGVFDPSALAPSFGWTFQKSGQPIVRRGVNEEDGYEYAVIEDNWLAYQTSSDAGFFFDSVLG